MCQRAVIRLWRNLEKWCVPAGYFHSYTHWHSHYPDTTWHVSWPSGKLSSSELTTTYTKEVGLVFSVICLSVCLSVSNSTEWLLANFFGKLVEIHNMGHWRSHLTMERIHKLFPTIQNFTKPQSNNFEPCQWQQKYVFNLWNLQLCFMMCLPQPIQVVFVPKPNQSISTALWRTDNWTSGNVKLQPFVLTYLRFCRNVLCQYIYSGV